MSNRPDKPHLRHRPPVIPNERKVMKMKTLRKYLTTAIISLALAFAPIKAMAQNSATYFMSKKPDVVRVESFNKLPLKIGSYTFVDLSKGGYFGKTTLNKSLHDNLGLEMKIVHADELMTKTGLGAHLKAMLPGEIFSKVSIIPVWYHKGGDMQNKTILGYFISKDLGKGYEASAFGEMDLDSKQFSYGETSLTKQIGDLKIGVQAAMTGDGDLTPDLEARVSVGVDL